MAHDQYAGAIEHKNLSAIGFFRSGAAAVAFIFLTAAPASSQSLPGGPITIPPRFQLPPVTIELPKPALTSIGASQCRFGDRECNVCVPSVVGQFSRLGVGAHGISGRMRFLIHAGETLPPANQKVEGFDKKHHAEGLARIPDPAAPNWFVISRATGRTDAGFLLVQMDRMNGNGGERMIPGIDKRTYDHVSATGEGVRRFVAVENTKHAGGIQMLGKLLFVPFNCESENGGCRPWIDVFDLSNKDNPDRVSRILLPGDNKKAFYASAVRLANGYTYVLVNRSNGADFDQYLSDSQTINHETHWLYLGRDNFGRFDGFYDREHLTSRPHGIGLRGSRHNDPFAYQNAGLVTECGTGNIYLAALRQHLGGAINRLKWKTDNQVDLFRFNLKEANLSQIRRIGEGSDIIRLEPTPRAAIWRTPIKNPHAGIDSLQYIARGSRKFDSQSGCKMRGGASMYVSPTGNLIAYCGPHKGAHGKLSLGEITSIGPRR